MFETVPVRGLAVLVRITVFDVDFLIMCHPFVFLFLHDILILSHMFQCNSNCA